MDLPANSWVNLALQVPLALVLVFMVVQFLKFIREMVGKFLETMSKQDEVNRKFIEDQQQLNREFISKSQESSNQAIGRLAEELKSNRVDTVKEVAALTNRVDAVLDKAVFFERINQMQQDMKK